MTTRPIKKTIWDFDNVLFESEYLAMDVMDREGLALVQKYDFTPEISPGVPLTRGYIYETYPGTSTDKIVEALIERFNLPLDAIKSDYGLGDIADEDVAGAIAEDITAKTIDAFKAGLNAIPGIPQALRQIDIDMGGIENRAGCTTSPEGRMNVSLEWATDPATGENAQLDALFPAVDNRRVSGYDYDNKYVHFFSLHPDWDPAECAIVEDSVSGVSKAKAASADVRVIGTIAADYYKDKNDQAAKLMKAGADIVIMDASDIPLALAWLSAGKDPDNKPAFRATVWTNAPSGNAPAPEPAPRS